MFNDIVVLSNLWTILDVLCFKPVLSSESQGMIYTEDGGFPTVYGMLPGV